MTPWVIGASLFLTEALSGSCANAAPEPGESSSAVRANAQEKRTVGYAPVNGMRMYYEVHGSGDPSCCSMARS